MVDRDELERRVALALRRRLATLASEQAARLATKATPGWWDNLVHTELRYTIHRIRHGHDPEPEWARLERRLLTLCREPSGRTAA